MVHEVVEKAYKLKENDYKLLVVGTSPERYELSREARFMAHSWDRPSPFERPRTGF
jgi:hypothetical protein